MWLIVDAEEDKVKVVEQRLRTEGFKPFEVELGGKGVGILEGVTEGMIEEFKVSVGSVAKDENGWLYWS
jgi:hypothetical protein